MMSTVLTMCAVLYADPVGGQDIASMAHGPYPCDVAEKIIKEYRGIYRAHAERVTPKWTRKIYIDAQRKSNFRW